MLRLSTLPRGFALLLCLLSPLMAQPVVVDNVVQDQAFNRRGPVTQSPVATQPVAVVDHVVATAPVNAVVASVNGVSVVSMPVVGHNVDVVFDTTAVQRLWHELQKVGVVSPVVQQVVNQAVAELRGAIDVLNNVDDTVTVDELEVLAGQTRLVFVKQLALVQNAIAGVRSTVVQRNAVEVTKLQNIVARMASQMSPVAVQRANGDIQTLSRLGRVQDQVLAGLVAEVEHHVTLASTVVTDVFVHEMIRRHLDRTAPVQLASAVRTALKEVWSTVSVLSVDAAPLVGVHNLQDVTPDSVRSVVVK